MPYSCSFWCRWCSVTDWRALTVRQPWTWAICHAGKDIENRTWPIPPKHLARPCSDCLDWMAEFGEATECSEPEPFRVMLHAGKGWSGPEAVREIREQSGRIPRRNNLGAHGYGVRNSDDGIVWFQPFGAVVAVVEFTGCHKSIDCVKSVMGGGEHCSPWAQGSTRIQATYDESTPEFETITPERDIDMWHWEIGEVTVLAEPVPAKGSLGLWRPKPDVIAAVEAQL